MGEPSLLVGIHIIINLYGKGRRCVWDGGWTGPRGKHQEWLYEEE